MFAKDLNCEYNYYGWRGRGKGGGRVDLSVPRYESLGLGTNHTLGYEEEKIPTGRLRL